MRSEKTALVGCPDELLGIVRPIWEARQGDRLSGMARVLGQLYASGAFNAPNLFCVPRPDRYGRKLIWRDPAGTLVIVGMTWAGGQASPVHDHGGVWGCELVVRGSIVEKRFQRTKHQAGTYCFAPRGERRHGPGNVAAFSPPLEYHSFGNADSGVAHTIHVYSGELSGAQTFSLQDDGSYRPAASVLHYDE